MFFLYKCLYLYPFRCLNLGTADAPEKFMDQDLNVPCWGTIHKRWVLIITLPSLIFWGIFVPVFALVKLMRNRDKLRTYKLKSRYGWLYEGLNEKNCYWEFFITYRKIVLILLSVFLVDLGTLMAVIAILFGCSANIFCNLGVCCCGCIDRQLLLPCVPKTIPSGNSKQIGRLFPFREHIGRICCAFLPYT